MRTVIKIVLTFVALMVATPLFAVTKEVPALKLVVTAGVLAGIVAIWKYNPEKAEAKQGENQDKHQLDKE